VNIAELSVVTIIDADGTTSFALNPGVTELNVTKISTLCTEITAD